MCNYSTVLALFVDCYCVIVRFVLIKYVDRGLVNDRYYYNMNMTLFKILFWTMNISFFLINQGNFVAFSIKYDGDLLTDQTYRLVLNCVVYSSTKQPGPLSLVEECRGWALIGQELHDVATPALLCHKEPALGALLLAGSL